MQIGETYFYQLIIFQLEHRYFNFDNFFLSNSKFHVSDFTQSYTIRNFIAIFPTIQNLQHYFQI